MDTMTQADARLTLLVKSAAETVGNETRLAEVLEVTRHNVNAWKHGRRVCPLDAQVIMADLSGADATEVLKEALIERHKGTPRGEKLAVALKKGLSKVGAVTALALCVPVALETNLHELLRCIKGLIWGRSSSPPCIHDISSVNKGAAL